MEQLFMGQTALFLNTCSKLKLNLVKNIVVYLWTRMRLPSLIFKI